MSKINSQTITIKLSQLLRDSEDEAQILSDDKLADLLAVLETLVGEKVLIEIED